MIISIEVIQNYLSLVNDSNPIHKDIIPGQLVCEIAFSELNIEWKYYKIKYLNPIDIHDDLYFSVENKSKIIVSNHLDRVKLIVFKN